MLLKCSGGVYNFDAEGVLYGADGWTQCLAVSVISASNVNHCHLWDRLIMEFSTSYETAYVFRHLLTFFRQNVAELNSREKYDVRLNVEWLAELCTDGRGFRCWMT